jgi:hypothetical protein
MSHLKSHCHLLCCKADSSLDLEVSMEIENFEKQKQNKNTLMGY